MLVALAVGVAIGFYVAWQQRQLDAEGVAREYLAAEQRGDLARQEDLLTDRSMARLATGQSEPLASYQITGPAEVTGAEARVPVELHYARLTPSGATKDRVVQGEVGLVRQGFGWKVDLPSSRLGGD